MVDKKEILKLCMGKGFFLDKAMLEVFVGLGEDKVGEIIEKLKGLGVEEGILTREVFERYKGNFDLVSEDAVGGKGVEVLDYVDFSSGKVEAGDFVSYFRARFDALRDILTTKGLGDSFSSIRRIGSVSGVYSVIGMVYSKRITKNKNLLIEIEDLTGRTIVLVNRENRELFERAKSLLLDDVVLFRVSGSSKMLFASDFIYPDASLEKERFGSKEEYVAFSSDFHVGSKNFLEGNLMRFVDWLNGEVGDERQRALARKVKYLILSGDNIEGVGVYPGQEKFLAIKGCRDQYKKLAGILGRIRKDVEIVMCPGQHDAVWIGEPQPAIADKWGGSLSELKNLKMISNPGMIKIDGLKILVYYGGSFNKFIDEMPLLRQSAMDNRSPIKVMKEILKRRHLAPSYGDMDIVLNKDRDDLVLRDLPDVVVSGGQHRAEVGSYNNILMVSGSCWQSVTPFEESVGSKPDPCKVPILNLKSREVKILDFSGSDVGEVGNE